MKGLGRTAQRFGITQVRLEGYELFEDILLSLGIDSALNIRGADNKLEMATAFSEIIRNPENELKLTDLRNPESFIKILTRLSADYAKRIYKGKKDRNLYVKK